MAKKYQIVDRRSDTEKLLDHLKVQRKISREIELESGIRHRSVVFDDKTKYNRKREKAKLRKETNKD